MKYLPVLLFFVFACSPKSTTTKESTKTSKIDGAKSNIAFTKQPDGTIQFPSKDSLPITADLYQKAGNQDLILLCHQARYSRGEYLHTAPKLLEMGYNCLAIDQRSGYKANDIYNQTAKAAMAKVINARYEDAKQDIEVAIDLAFELNNHKPIIIVGSSYSASWVLQLAVNNPKIKKVAAFSPGEYFRSVNISEAIKELKIPVFVTCAKNEVDKTTQVLQFVNPEILTFYKPNETGIHGSRALWKTTEGQKGYWAAFSEWLKK